MSWYKKSMATMWGTMGSGIMFRHNGRILLQLRSADVEEGGTWGIPGGAMEGTEGWYDSGSLQRPEMTDELLLDLWDSAIKEAGEEIGFDLGIGYEQFEAAKRERVVNWIDNFPYVTFIVDLTDEQASRLAEEQSLNWESEGHEWFSPKEFPENTHPGVDYVIDKMNPSFSIEQASISKEIPTTIGVCKFAESKWTQGQVYDDGENIYDMELLEKLVKDNRVERVKVRTLVAQMHDKDVWGEGERRLSPMMVLVNPTFDHLSIKHMSRIRTANLDKPILIRVKGGKIVDGFHRLSKAFLIGESKIQARFIQEEQMRKAIFSDR